MAKINKQAQMLAFKLVEFGWEHCLRDGDERDFQQPIDYIHYNPVKYEHFKMRK
jgi:hypothetical protein